jgi:apolipoprotein N-acyltransferase
VISGLLLAAAFPPVGLFPLVFVALVPLFFAVEHSDPRRGRRGAAGARTRRLFAVGWTSGFVFFLALLYWIPFLPPNNLTIPWLMGPSLVIMAAYLALFPGLFALALGWSRAGGRVSFLIAAPALWAGLEYLRSVGTIGFPWGSAGYALAPMASTLQFASVTGIWGVSAWIVLINALFYLVLQRTQGKRRALDLSLVILAFAIPSIQARNVLMRPLPPERARVALIQANVDSETKWDPEFREAIVEKLFRLTREAARDSSLDLIVWSEAAPPFLLARDPVYLPRVRALVDSLGVPLLAGTVDSRRGADGHLKHYNSVVLLRPGDPALDIYDKARLVPFSERMPFQGALPFLSAFDWGQSDFSPGESRAPFEMGGHRIGPLICFEAIFPPQARGFVDGGADFLVNITNDQWFGNTAAPSQHAAMAVFRAVENRRAIGRCANTGITMIIDPFGRVTARTPTFVETTLVGDLALPVEETFYSRHGDVAAAVFLAVSLVLMVLPLALKPL